MPDPADRLPLLLALLTTPDGASGPWPVEGWQDFANRTAGLLELAGVWLLQEGVAEPLAAWPLGSDMPADSVRIAARGGGGVVAGWLVLPADHAVDAALLALLAGRIGLELERRRLSAALGLAAHNLKNPLGVILGRCEMIALYRSGELVPRDGDVEGRVAASLADIEKAARRMQDIIQTRLTDTAQAAGVSPLAPRGH